MNDGFRFQNHLGPFVIIPVSMIGNPQISDGTLRVWLAIKSFARPVSDSEPWSCKVTAEQIALRSTKHRTTVFRSIEQLESLGYLARSKEKDKHGLVVVFYFIHDAVAAHTGGKDAVHVKAGLSRTKLLTPSHNATTPVAQCDSHSSINHLIDIDINKNINNNTEEKLFRDEWIESNRQKILQFFPQALPSKIDKDLYRWKELYGAEKTEQCVTDAMDYIRRTGKSYTDPGRYLGNWLKGNAFRDKMNVHFKDFWTMWLHVGGCDDGKKGAMDEFQKRFAAIPDDAARSKALDVLFFWLEKLSERKEQGEDPKFFGKAKNWLADVDLEGDA